MTASMPIRQAIGSAIRESMRVSDCVWFSYYWKHQLETLSMAYSNMLRFRKGAWTYKPFVWRFTFGQHKQTDFGSGFRPMLRLTSTRAKFYADQCRVPSARMKAGDKRANPAGRVPDDVFDFPRVVGNAHERRPWHPTQHPKALIERIILAHTKPGDTVLDMYAGTGTVARACEALGRNSVSCETSKEYCARLVGELGVGLFHNFHQWKDYTDRH